RSRRRSWNGSPRGSRRGSNSPRTSESPMPGEEPIPLDRRELLETMGIAAGGVLASGALHAGDVPGNQVADRTSPIKLTKLTGFPTGPKCYVKLETNHGIVGWGEVTGSEPAVAKVLAESLFQLLDGENPTRIEYLWQRLFRSHRDMRGGPIMTHVIAAID